MTQRRSSHPAANNIRRKLEAEFKRPIPERMWQYLLALGVIEDYLACPDSDTWQNVKWHCREQFALIKSARVPRRQQAGRGKRLEVRLTGFGALDRVVAAEASRLPEVCWFREQFLGGRLIPREEIPKWLTEQGLSQGAPTRFVTVTFALPDDFKLPRRNARKQLHALANLPQTAFTVEPPYQETITYWDPQQGQGTIPIRYRSSLWYLRRVIDRVQEEYPIWSMPNAGVSESGVIAFILSGVPPCLATAEIAEDPTKRYPPMIRMFCPVGTRRRLVDIALSTVFQVAAQLARRGCPQDATALGGAKHPRSREMTEKKLRLAVYLAEHFETPWPQLMASWNAEHPKWAYANWRTFARDAKAAWCRVTGRKWTPRRAGKERMQNAEEES